MKELFDKSTGLTLLRITIAILVIKKIIFCLPMNEQLFGPAGMVPNEIYSNAIKYYHLGYLEYPFYLPFAPFVFLILILIAAILFLLGLYKTLTGLVLYFLLLILKLRNNFILDGSDNVIEVLLPLLLIAENSFHEKAKGILKDILLLTNKFGILAVMVQVCFIYFFTALAKLQGDLWLNGTAIYYAMRVEEFRATSWNIPLTRNHYFVVFSTYATILIELAFPFWMWFKNTKFYIISLCIIFHVGIWIFMRIDDFSWVMIGSYSVFISNGEFEKIKQLFDSFLIYIKFNSLVKMIKR